MLPCHWFVSRVTNLFSPQLITYRRLVFRPSRRIPTGKVPFSVSGRRTDSRPDTRGLRYLGFSIKRHVGFRKWRFISNGMRSPVSWVKVVYETWQGLRLIFNKVSFFYCFDFYSTLIMSSDMQRSRIIIKHMMTSLSASHQRERMKIKTGKENWWKIKQIW